MPKKQSFQQYLIKEYLDLQSAQTSGLCPKIIGIWVIILGIVEVHVCPKRFNSDDLGQIP